MDTFEPIINLVLTLTILSVIAERFTNYLKLGSAKLRKIPDDEDKRIGRVHAIQTRSLVVCLGVAILLKADLFSMMSSADSPWSTLGWAHVEGPRWAWTSALAGKASFAYALGGCLVTGLALGFGAKFWHDILGAMYEVRDLARGKNVRKQQTPPATGTPAAKGSES